jgi:hypothetical protein
LRGAGIHADDVASHSGELGGECAVAAAEVEDALARAWSEEFDNGRA